MSPRRIAARTFVLSLGAALLAPSSARAQGSRVPETHAIVNAKIVVGDGTVLEKGRVVVRDGRIEIVDASTQAPPDARVLDASGLTVYAGWIDASVVAGIAPAPVVGEGPPPDTLTDAFARTPETHRKGVHPDLRASERLDVADDAAAPRRQAGFALAHFEPSAPTLGGTTALAELNGAGRRESIVRPDVAMAAELRAAEGEGYPGSRMGAIALFRQALLDADWHQKSWAAFRRAPAAMKAPPVDPMLQSLAPVIDGSMPVAFEASTAPDILRALAVAEEMKVKPWIVGGTEAFKCAAVLAAKKVPVLLSLDFGAEPKEPASSRPGSRAASSRAGTESAPATSSAPATASAPASRPAWPNPDAEPERLRAERKRKHDERISNAAALSKAGVRFAFTTRGLKAPGDIHAAIAKAVEKGLDRDAALAALTSASAAILGAEDAAGRVAAGRPAHLTIVKGAVGDKDVKVRAVFVEGRRYDFDEESGGAPSEPGADRPRRRPRGDDDGDRNGGAR